MPGKRAGKFTPKQCSAGFRGSQRGSRHTGAHCKGKTHPVGELSYVAEQTISPLKEKSSQRCLCDFWAAHRKEKQSRDCPWRTHCQCFVKISAYRMLFSARCVLFSLQGDFSIKRDKECLTIPVNYISTYNFFFQVAEDDHFFLPMLDELWLSNL